MLAGTVFPSHLLRAAVEVDLGSGLGELLLWLCISEWNWISFFCTAKQGTWPRKPWLFIKASGGTCEGETVAV